MCTFYGFLMLVGIIIALFLIVYILGIIGRLRDAVDTRDLLLNWYNLVVGWVITIAIVVLAVMAFWSYELGQKFCS